MAVRVGGLKAIAVAVMLALSFLTFQYFPYFGKYARELWLGALLLIVPFYILFSGSRKEFRLYRRYRIYVFCTLLLAFYTAATAWVHYGQEVIYGLVAQRSLAASLFGILLIAWYRRGRLSVHEIMKGCILLGWFVLFVNLFLFLVIDPSGYTDFAGFAAGHWSTRYVFHYNYDFMAFLFFVLFLRVIHRSDFRYLPVLGVMLGFVALIAQKRAAVVAMLMAVAIYVLRDMKLGRAVIVVQGALFFGTVGLIGAYFYSPDMFAVAADRFTDAITVVVTGSLTDEDSANTRVYQLEIAKDYIYSNPVFGNGRISAAWKDGYNTFISHRFFPTDMGFFGAVYVYGIFGVLFLLVQFYFPFAANRQIKRNTEPYILRVSDIGIFSQALIMLVVYYFAYGLMHGMSFFDPFRVLNVSALLIILANEAVAGDRERSKG